MLGLTLSVGQAASHPPPAKQRAWEHGPASHSANMPTAGQALSQAPSQAPALTGSLTTDLLGSWYVPGAILDANSDFRELVVSERQTDRQTRHQLESPPIGASGGGGAGGRGGEDTGSIKRLE